jgi:spore coat protein A, manganese oxidase
MSLAGSSVLRHCRAALVPLALALLIPAPSLGDPIRETVDPPGGAVVISPTLNPNRLVKWMDPLPIPGPMPSAAPNYYEIGMWPTTHRFHASLPVVPVWGYGPTQALASYPAATIEAVRGVPIQVRWTNHLPEEHLLEDAIDHTLHMAMPEEGVPAVAHLHGGESEPASDGGPDAWFTPGFAEKGAGWVKEVYTYHNAQPPATLWYHDHALGLTRLNVYAGLAGFYLLRDPGNEPPGLPSGAYEVPIAIQDRMLTPEGELYYPNEGDNEEHPVWVPEFFGDIIVVNGKAWPYLNVEPRKYRFRFLNGSNARFYALKLTGEAGADGPAFRQIGTDGGYLEAPVTLNVPGDPTSPRLLIAPGERADVVIDFSGYTPGARLTLVNNARAPFPKGATVDPRTTGQILQFRVVAPTGPDPSVVPATLGTIPDLGPAALTRTLTLNEVMGANGPLEALLNGTPWDAAATELPVLGTTEVWEVVNLTGDAHPIHLHGVQFQMLNRQKVNVKRYEKAWVQANGMAPVMGEVAPVAVGPYAVGMPVPPDANELGWKDTFRMNPGEVTRVIIRFAPSSGAPAFPYDATAEPGYVWHCHIIEHEDNEMMRPLKMVAPAIARDVDRGASAPAVEDAARVLAGGGPFELRIELARASAITVEVFDVRGARVRTLAAEPFAAGAHVVRWDGRDAAGAATASGMYFYRVTAPQTRAVTRKALVLR